MIFLIYIDHFEYAGVGILPPFNAIRLQMAEIL